MTTPDRDDCVRLDTIAAYMRDHVEIDMPTITPGAVHWAITGRPVMEAAVLAVVDNWKLVHRGPRTDLLAGYHPQLGAVTASFDRFGAGLEERDWASVGVAVPEAVSAS